MPRCGINIMCQSKCQALFYSPFSLTQLHVVPAIISRNRSENGQLFQTATKALLLFDWFPVSRFADGRNYLLKKVRL